MRLMSVGGEGLTKTYNRVHDPEDATPEIVQLRELHVALDHAVRDAYGWDLDLDHGFHPTDQGVRFTLGPAARVEVLDLPPRGEPPPPRGGGQGGSRVARR